MGFGIEHSDVVEHPSEALRRCIRAGQSEETDCSLDDLHSIDQLSRMTIGFPASESGPKG